MGLHGNNIIAGKTMHSAPDRGAHFTARGHLATFEESTEAHVNLAFDQNFPQSTLSGELQNANPRGIWRLVDGQPSREPLQ